MDVVDLTLSEEETESGSVNGPAPRKQNQPLKQQQEQQQQIMVQHGSGRIRPSPAFSPVVKPPRQARHPQTKRGRSQADEAMIDALTICESDGDMPAVKRPHMDMDCIEILDPQLDTATGPSPVSAPGCKDDTSAAAAHANALLADLRRAREARQQQMASASHTSMSMKPPGGSVSGQNLAPSNPTLSQAAHHSKEVSILSYNVWSEPVALRARMKGISAAIHAAGYPHILMFQGVTDDIILLWKQEGWWQRYNSSVPPMPGQRGHITVLCWLKGEVQATALPAEIPFPSSVMGRGLRHMKVELFGRQLRVATSHLESPQPGGAPDLYVEARQEQLGQSLHFLGTASSDCDAILAGDMNWEESMPSSSGLTTWRDGYMKLPMMWQDAWPILRPDEKGLTWDPSSNQMLPLDSHGSRPDRAICKLGHAFTASTIELVGCSPVEGAAYVNENNDIKQVYPSNHFGILLKLKLAGEAIRLC